MMRKDTKVRVFLTLCLALSLDTSSLPAAEKKAARRSDLPASKVTQIPKAAIGSRNASANAKPLTVTGHSKFDFVKTPTDFEPKSSSSLRMDGSKQDKSYDVVSIPFGGGSTDNLPVTPELPK